MAAEVSERDAAMAGPFEDGKASPSEGRLRDGFGDLVSVSERVEPRLNRALLNGANVRLTRRRPVRPRLETTLLLGRGRGRAVATR
jgi:hypothetical protein